MHMFKFSRYQYVILTDDFIMTVGTLSIDLHSFVVDNTTNRADIHNKTTEEACKIMNIQPGEYVGYIDVIPTPETHPELLI